MVNLESTASIVADRINQVESSIRTLLKEPSASSVHRMRVASRQLETSLYLTKSSYRRKDYDYFRSVCEFLIRSSSKVRDIDVLLAEGVDAESRIKKSMLKARKRAAKKLKSRVGHLFNSNAFSRHQLRVEKEWEPPTNEQFRVRLLRLYGRLLVAIPDDISTVKNLHRWRIAIKRLRYALDLMIAGKNDHWLEFTKALLVELQDETGLELDQVNIARGFKQYGFNFKVATRSHKDSTWAETNYHAFQIFRVHLGFTKILLRTLENLDS